jgi:hypothetical protein
LARADREDATERLTRARAIDLIRHAAVQLELDLTGTVVLTEAATRAYAVTPVIAAMAGARQVEALGKDSDHGRAPEAFAEVAALARDAGVDERSIRFCGSREEISADANLITNLGPLRPIDRDLLSRLQGPAVVSLMYEAWEARPGEISFQSCGEFGIPVAGVWEDFGSLGVFRSCGTLAVKLCFEAGLEVAGSRLIVLGEETPFCSVISDALERAGATATHLASAEELTKETVVAADAIVVVDYYADVAVLCGDTGPDASAIASWNPFLRVVQFYGPVEVEGLLEAGLPVYPARRLAPRTMAFTLAHLGLRPIVNLQTAGLKVGELLWRRLANGDSYGKYESLVQEIDVTQATPSPGLDGSR